jgi:hypothetical protein
MLHKDIQGAHRTATQTQVAQMVEERRQLPHPAGFYISIGETEEVLSHYCPGCKVGTKLFGTFENREVKHCGRVDVFKNSFIRRLFLPKQSVVTRHAGLLAV